MVHGYPAILCSACRVSQRHSGLTCYLSAVLLGTQQLEQAPTNPPILAGQQVEFDELRSTLGRSVRDRADFWERSKRLAHGTLVCLLAVRPPGGGMPGEERMVFVTVAQRDPKELARAEGRPLLGIRWAARCAGVWELGVCAVLRAGG